MSKRIGKYKVSDKESTLSLADGGTIDGNINIKGSSVKLSGIPNVSHSNATAQYMLFTTSSGYLGHQVGVEPTGSFGVVCMRTGS